MAPNVRQFQGSFAGGEVSDAMLGRITDSRFRGGAKRARNMVTLPTGPATRRPRFDHVRATKAGNESLYTRMIPFSFGGNDTLAVEMGNNYFRFHTGGQTVLYADTRVITAVDTGEDTLTFASYHRFASNAAVKMLRNQGGSGLAPLDETTTYYVIYVSPTKIKLSTVDGPGGPVNLTTAATGTHAIYPVSQSPLAYRAPAVVSTIFLPANVVEFTASHPFVTQDPVHVTASVMPGGVSAATRYYARNVASNQITLHTTAAGAGTGADIVDIHTSAGTSVVVHYDYVAGDVISGSAQGPLYITQDHPVVASNGVLMPMTGELQVYSYYTTSELATLSYRQSGATIRFAGQNQNPTELTRVSATRWTITFKTIGAPNLTVPTITSPISRTFGEYVTFYLNPGYTMTTYPGNEPALCITGSGAPTTLVPGDVVYVEDVAAGVGSGPPGWAPGSTYVVSQVQAYPGAVWGVTTFYLRGITGGSNLVSPTATQLGYYRRASLSSESTETYVVTALDAAGAETTPSAAVAAANNPLSITGSYNTIAWTAISGAARYRVYKKQNGLYGLIGTTTETSFKDDNKPVDLATTPPSIDTTLANPYPGVISAFEQREIFARTTNSPQGIWFSNVGSPYSLAYHLPLVDTDRIQFLLEGPESCTIRHVVPMSNLVILTDAVEFVVTPVNSDAITPTSFRARQASYNGATYVRPQLLNDTLYYVAARTNHIRDFKRAEGGFGSDDVSIRASHLFDNYTIVDTALMRAPYPILWALRSDGVLLGFTTMPEEGVGGWHQHETDGTIVSICCVNEGAEDALYAVIRRLDSNGSTVQFVERMREFSYAGNGDNRDNAFLDSCVSYDGRNASATTVTVTSTGGWSAGAAVTLTFSAANLLPGLLDSGSGVTITSGGVDYVFDFTAISSFTVATATAIAAVPSAIQNTAVTTWRLHHKTFHGYAKSFATVAGTRTVLADGKTIANVIVTGDSVTVPDRTSVLHVGRPYESQLWTLPVAVQIDPASAQGRTKNVSRLWLRIAYSQRFRVGPEQLYDVQGAEIAELMVPTNEIPNGTVKVEGTIDVSLPGQWTDDGWVRVETSDAGPLTVISLCGEVAIGS